MTDNKTIKALECCKVCSSPEHCGECPYVECTTTKGCVGEMLTDVLDLINRQKAEIEELERELEDLSSIEEISPEAKYIVDTKADKIISLLNEINKSQE